jgi:hypothetical protein
MFATGSETLADERLRRALDDKPLMTAAIPARQLDRRARHVQQFGEEANQCRVSGTIHRWGRETHHQAAVSFAGGLST